MSDSTPEPQPINQATLERMQQAWLHAAKGEANTVVAARVADAMVAEERERWQPLYDVAMQWGNEPLMRAALRSVGEQ